MERCTTKGGCRPLARRCMGRFRLSRPVSASGMLAEKRRVVQSKDSFTIRDVARRDRPAAPGEEGRALGRRLQGDDGAVAKFAIPLLSSWTR
jgi:hypothetical protein